MGSQKEIQKTFAEIKMGIFGIAKRGFGLLKKSKKGKEWDILKKHPSLAKQRYSKSAVNKMLSKDLKKKK